LNLQHFLLAYILFFSSSTMCLTAEDKNYFCHWNQFGKIYIHLIVSLIRYHCLNISCNTRLKILLYSLFRSSGIKSTQGSYICGMTCRWLDSHTKTLISYESLFITKDEGEVLGHLLQVKQYKWKTDDVKLETWNLTW
jgi:hypothetical protein